MITSSIYFSSSGNLYICTILKLNKIQMIFSFVIFWPKFNTFWCWDFSKNQQADIMHILKTERHSIKCFGRNSYYSVNLGRVSCLNSFLNSFLIYEMIFYIIWIWNCTIIYNIKSAIRTNDQNDNQSYSFQNFLIVNHIFDQDNL